MRTRACISAALLILAAASAAAADRIVSIPSGWTVCPYIFSASSQGIALILYPTTSDPFDSTSRIMLIPISGAPKLTELQGKAFAISTTPSGTYVLVHHNNADGPKVSLLSGTSGDVVWTKANEPRQFAFSATGNALFARRVKSEWTGAGTDVEVFNLAGATIRRVDLSTIPRAVLLSDSDSDVVLALERTIERFDFSQVPMVKSWSQSLAAGDEPLSSLGVIGADRFVASQELGKFRVMKWNGTVDYTFDPASLDAADPSRNFGDYASYMPYATPLANKLLLFNGSYDGLILNLTNGALTSKSLDLAAPGGFKLIPHFESSQLVFASDTQIRIRSISF